MAKLKKLSIVIPCYNEKQTLREIVAEVLSVDTGRIKKELIIIDDASKDGTGAIAENWPGGTPK